MEQPKNKGGRPRKDPSELLKLGAMRLKPEHWEKIEYAGMDALRKLLDRWKPKPKQ